MLLANNRHELHDMEAMARRYGVKFRFDAGVFPGLEGDAGQTSLRVSPEQAVIEDFADKERAKEWREYFRRTRSSALSDRLYLCGAGVSHFHVDPFGILRPCLVVRNVGASLLDNSFGEVWRSIVTLMDDKKASEDSVCVNCDKKALCGYCPAFFELESGSELVRSNFLCKLGQLRFEAIMDRPATGENSDRRQEVKELQTAV